MKLNSLQTTDCKARFGGLAQLARAPALQAGGQRFESVILHCLVRFLIVLEMIFDILTNVKAMTIDT